MSCSCSDDIRSKLVGSGRNRRIGFAEVLQDSDVHWFDHHVVFVQETPERSRHGRAYVVCACEPGHTRVGGGTVVFYGKNTKALEEAYDATPDPTILVLLYEGTRFTGGALKRIQQRAEADGRELHVYRFIERCSLEVRPLDPQPRLRLVRRLVRRPV